MVKHTDPFIGNRAYGRGAAANTINLSQAGTRQFAPDLANLASNTVHVRRNAIPFLIRAPRFFRFMPDSQLWVRSLKALVETHTRTVEGLSQQRTAEFSDSPYGGAGEVIQSVTNVTRQRSQPVHGMVELNGRAIQNFILDWMLYGYGHEDTKVPLAVANGNVRSTDWDITWAGATVLYVVPDPTMTDVVSAYLCTNWGPETTGPWDDSKDAGIMGQQVDLSIQFTAITDVSIGTKLFARQKLRELNLMGMNPHENPLWLEDISADVRRANNGLLDQTVRGAAERITY